MGWDEAVKTPLLNEPQQEKQKIETGKRSCNDILFAILFIACVVGMLVVSNKFGIVKSYRIVRLVCT